MKDELKKDGNIKMKEDELITDHKLNYPRMYPAPAY